MGILSWLFPKVETPPESARQLGRNEPCWCNSGEKYKSCHFEKDRDLFARQDALRRAACNPYG